MMVAGMVVSSTVLADPPSKIQLGEQYTEKNLEKLVSHTVDEDVTIFVRSEFGPQVWGSAINNDLFIINELDPPLKKSLGEVIGMVRRPGGGVAYKKTVECKFIDETKSAENGNTYRVFDCVLHNNPHASGGSPVKVQRSLNGDITFN